MHEASFLHFVDVGEQWRWQVDGGATAACRNKGGLAVCRRPRQDEENDRVMLDCSVGEGRAPDVVKVCGTASQPGSSSTL